MGKRGFTLIELLVIIAIFMVLASVVLTLSKEVQKAKQSTYQQCVAVCYEKN